MPALLRHPITRFITTTALVGSLADWVLFAAMVVTVDGMLGGGPWSTAAVLVARIAPAVAFAPVAARRIDRGDLTASLVRFEALRWLAAAALLVSASARSVPGALVSIVALEYAAAMQAAGREALISRHAPRALFTRVNTATAVLSYGFLAVGPLVVELVGPTPAWVGALAGYAIVVAACARLHASDATAATLPAATAAVGGDDPVGDGRPDRMQRWRVVVAAALGIMPAVALFSTGPDVAATWLGDRAATGRLYAVVLAGGAAGFALANARRFRAEFGLGMAAAGLAVAAMGPWTVGLALLGGGAGAAYLDLQTRLQHAAHDPSEFAAAFAVLKLTTAAAVVAGPAVMATGGLSALLLGGTLLAAAGASVASGSSAAVLRTAIREALAGVLRLLVRVEVANPGQRAPGPVVVVSNHPHWLDGALAVLADRSLRPIARWQRSRLVRAAIWVGGCVVTTSGTQRDPRPAYAQAADHLRSGGRIWLAPEGGSHQDTVLRRPRTGAVRMARAADVPIQPLAILADHGVATGPRLRAWRPWRRPRVRLVWGRPVRTSGDVDRDNETMLAALAAVTGLGLPTPAATPASAALPTAA